MKLIQHQGNNSYPIAFLRLIGLIFSLIGGVLQSAVDRQFVPTVICGFMYTILPVGPVTWLWTPYGMLLGTAVGLMLDEDAGADLAGPLDRVDHAAMAVALGLLVHIAIYA